MRRSDRAGAQRVAIYTRISADRDGEGLGVERQEQDCRALAERLGLEVAKVYVENDVSASTASQKPRPQYGAMIRGVREGRYDAIVAYSNSRLTRRPRELEDLIDLHAATRVLIKTVVSGDDDLSTADGRMVARIKANVDAAEAERTAERVRRAKEQAVAAGRYRGGPRPYGFEKDGVTVREAEAAVIRRLTEQVLAGRSLHSLARELNAEGLTSSTGKPWTQPRVKDVLIRPRNAGLVHVGRADGRGESRPQREQEFRIVGKAEWPAIVTEDEWRAVHSMLVDPSRRTNLANEAKWLLTNIAQCGRDGCDSKMKATSNLWRQTSKDPNKPRVRRANYRCRDNNHLTIDAVKTDNWIKQVVAETVRDPRVRKAMTAGDGEAIEADRERRHQLDLRLKQTERDYDDDLIDGHRYKAKKAKITKEIHEIDQRLADAAEEHAASSVFSKLDPGAAFLEAPLDVQRAVLRSVMTVTVLPAAKRGDKWNSGRLEIKPVHQLEDQIPA